MTVVFPAVQYNAALLAGVRVCMELAGLTAKQRQALVSSREFRAALKRERDALKKQFEKKTKGDK